MSIDNDEKTKHIETIFKSINWLIENSLWDEIEKVMRYCVVEAALKVTKKLKESKGDHADSKEKYSYPKELHKIIGDVLEERE